MSLLLLRKKRSVAATSVAGLLSYWDPLNLSTLFKEVAGTTPVSANGDTVGYMGGLVNAVASADDATRPTYAVAGINGYPAIQYAGASSQKLTANALAASLDGADAPFTLIAVVQTTTPGTNQNFFTAGRAASGNPFIIVRGTTGSAWDTLRRDDAVASVQITPSSPTMGAGVAYVLAVRFLGTTQEIWVNGVLINGPTAMNVGAITLDRVTLGALGTTAYSQFLTGFLGRMALYSAAISDADLFGVTRNFRNAYRI